MREKDTPESDRDKFLGIQRTLVPVVLVHRFWLTGVTAANRSIYL